MGIFQKIIEGFRPSMTAEEENAVRGKIAEFDLAVHRMTGRYISLGEIDAFKGSWNPDIPADKFSCKHFCIMV